MPSYLSPTYASRRRSSDRTKQRSPSPIEGERSPLSPMSAARVSKAQAAAMEGTPPRTPASVRSGRRLAVHQAISPQQLAAGARVSAQRGAKILRLEAEAAARRAAAKELEEVRGAISQRGAPAATPVGTPTPQPITPAAGPPTMADDVTAAASAMAAWASNMRSRLADKDDELAQVRAALAEERGKVDDARLRPERSNATAKYVEELTARLRSSEDEVAHLRAALSASVLSNEQALRESAENVAAQWKMEREQADQGRELAAAAQLEVANLRQRCEAAEHMLWLTESKAETDEKACVRRAGWACGVCPCVSLVLRADPRERTHVVCRLLQFAYRWLEWKAAALTRIELLQDAVDAHEGSPPKQSQGMAAAAAAAAAAARVHLGDDTVSDNAAPAAGSERKADGASASESAAVDRDQDWPWDDEDAELRDHEDLNDGVRELLSTISELKQQRQREQQQPQQQEQQQQEGGGDDIWKLRDELAVLNAKVKGLEDELEDELAGSEDQASTQETSEESDERERHRESESEKTYATDDLSLDLDDNERWLFETYGSASPAPAPPSQPEDTASSSRRQRPQPPQQQPFGDGEKDGRWGVKSSGGSDRQVGHRSSSETGHVPHPSSLPVDSAHGSIYQQSSSASVLADSC